MVSLGNAVSTSTLQPLSRVLDGISRKSGSRGREEGVQDQTQCKRDIVGVFLLELREAPKSIDSPSSNLSRDLAQCNYWARVKQGRYPCMSQAAELPNSGPSCPGHACTPSAGHDFEMCSRSPEQFLAGAVCGQHENVNRRRERCLGNHKRRTKSRKSRRILSEFVKRPIRCGLSTHSARHLAVMNTQQVDWKEQHAME